MVRRSPLGALLALALVPTVLLAAAHPLSGAATPRVGDQDVIVVLKDGANPAAAAEDLGVTPRQVHRHVFRGFAGRVPAAAAAGLRRNPRVALVSENLPVAVHAQHMPTGIDRIDADLHPRAAIGGEPGPAVDADVAVLDSGIAPDHPDLNVVGGVNFLGTGGVGCTGTENWADDRGHGTAVAGIIGARDDGAGVVGVAPGARLWSIKVITQDNKGTMADLICALDWVIANKGTIDVVNMSLGFSYYDDGPCSAHPLHLAICRVVNDAGIPVVVSAGNSANDAARYLPATYDEVITVSAFADYDGRPGGAGAYPSRCDNSTASKVADDRFTAFGNFGPDVDIAAPGQAIQTTWYQGGASFCWWGTSFSAPHVAGAVALFKAGNPNATPAQVRAWLLERASRAQGSASGIQGDPDGIPEPVLAVGVEPLPIVDESQSKNSRGAALAHDGDPATFWATVPANRPPAAGSV
ncbi:MAG: S8 family serine peptidase [Chloroflexota bacterium]|nr:S8 family serine peptidase [Chloroflexota bacterium]